MFLCDTAQQLVDGARADEVVIVRLTSETGEIILHSRDVQEAVRKHEGVKDTVNKRKNKKIVVPTNMIVRNRHDGGLLLLSSMGSYDRRFAANVLQCDESLVDHDGIDLEEVVGRKRGECSVVIETSSLRRLSRVQFGGRKDDTIKEAIGHPNTIVVYPLGDKQFLCMDAPAFTAGYRQVLQKTGVKSNL